MTLLRSRWARAWLAAATMAWSVPASATEDTLPAARWAGPTALTLAPGRVELGLLSEAAWGVTERVELRLHPLLFWALPHAEGKLRLLSIGDFHLSSTHRLSHPTPLLSLVSREGSGGLLPPTERAPLALMLDNDLIASASWLRGQLLSVRAGASAAVSGRGAHTLLDFPFLYQRLAALHAPVVPRVALVASGRAGAHLGYELELRHYWLPLDDFSPAQATEYAAALQLLIGTDHRVELGGRVSSAQLPVGRRSHFLPHVDYRIAF